eukprot:COSAG06_NODE_4765_length_3973_cov_118.929014_4_plen_42_part_00
MCGYDLTVLSNGWLVHTAVIYGVGNDGEWCGSANLGAVFLT